MTALPVPVVEVAAALLTDSAGRLVLVRKRGTTRYMQAGGKLEPGETARQALVRELGEELEYRPSPDDLADEAGYRAYDRDAEHDRIRREELLPLTAELVRVQFATEATPPA